MHVFFMLIIAATLVWCDSGSPQPVPVAGQAMYHASYDLVHPDETQTLPLILKEVSGIAIADSTHIYCIQDEEGTVFRYHWKEQKITQLIRFGDAGDYEDLAVVNGLIHVVRSDARVFVVDPVRNSTVRTYSLSVSCSEVEGLAYDSQTEEMYLACKTADEKSEGSFRKVYRYPVENPSALSVALTIDTRDIASRVKAGSEKFHFNPSAIGVHPQTGDLYVLSAQNGYLAVYRGNTLLHVYSLAPKMYPQPEGLAFSPDGLLFLASEAQKKAEAGGILYAFPEN